MPEGAGPLPPRPAGVTATASGKPLREPRRKQHRRGEGTRREAAALGTARLPRRALRAPSHGPGSPRSYLLSASPEKTAASLSLPAGPRTRRRRGRRWPGVRREPGPPGSPSRSAGRGGDKTARAAPRSAPRPRRPTDPQPPRRRPRHRARRGEQWWPPPSARSPPSNPRSAPPPRPPAAATRTLESASPTPPAPRAPPLPARRGGAAPPVTAAPVKAGPAIYTPRGPPPSAPSSPPKPASAPPESCPALVPQLLPKPPAQVMTLPTCLAPCSELPHSASPTGAGAPRRRPPGRVGATGPRVHLQRPPSPPSRRGPHAHSPATLGAPPRAGPAPLPRLWTPALLLLHGPHSGSLTVTGGRGWKTPSPRPSRLHFLARLSESWGRGRVAARRPLGPDPAPAADAGGAPPSPARAPRHRPLLLPARPRTPADPAPFPEITTRPTAGPRGGWCPRLLTVGRLGSARSCGARQTAPWRGSRSCGRLHRAIVARHSVGDREVTQVQVLLERECGSVSVR